ncbi:acetyl-CoA carboxylase biotin carboxylase subunit [Aquitalea palustris]|uniref:biotin carboxylase n=1 Tax=Aquitalea palustris TaxID=2480983 RepID=A0A454JE69_9NEIS|nr:acetyl-CoA carboxylase biotin carboxylase subunit [Aquitalea palustris]RMC92774.1 acetyl-CoA carboxylase biotin carboxylase subunit [Aquitalea palustris]
MTQPIVLKNIRRLLVANRGEIAVRIIRAAREMGVQTVLAHSRADRHSLACQLADLAVEIGPAPASKSYLDINAVMHAARTHAVDAVHPGYGFLAENAEFARAVEAAGMIFVGPTAQTIAQMGDKARARATAQAAGVATVPGSKGALDHVAAAIDAAKDIGYPLMIKAVAGGGGRGIRVVDSASALPAAFAAAQREAQSAFGDGQLYLERFMPQARHLEVQILGDGQRVIHCYERECSLQRRRQKIMEEAPSPALNDRQRSSLCQAAVQLAQSVAYRGAGTLEFLFDQGEFYFIEMNTRIQVEHPISEMITGIDLLREMLLIADGQPLRWQQQDIQLRGAAIECRINAEDPRQDFRPSPGTILNLQLPGGPGVRFDSMLFQGYVIPPYYDSMLAKLIVWDESRERALSRMRRALGELHIGGIAHTQSLHQALLADADVCAGRYHTRFLEQWLTHWQDGEAAASPAASHEGGLA